MTGIPKPLGQYVIIELDAAAESVGSIYIPEQHREEILEGIVRALGTGKRLKNGNRQQFHVKPGDRVTLGKFAGTELFVHGRRFKLVLEDDILAVKERMAA